MIADVFSTKEIVRIFDFLLDDPISQYTKLDIAKGASVSRPTVDKIIPQLIKMGVLVETRKFGKAKLFELDVSSPLVVSLVKFDSELSKSLVNSNIDGLHPDELDDYLSNSKYLVEILSDYLQNVHIFESQTIWPKKLDNSYSSRVLIDSVSIDSNPSSA